MKSMHRLLIALLPLAAFVASPAARAQDSGSASPPAQDQPAPKPHKRPNRVEMLRNRLGLSDDQMAKVKPILEQERGQIEAIRSDDSLSQDQKREKMRAVFQQTNQAIRAQLTPDQQQKLDDMMAHMRHHRDNPPPADNGNPSPPPSNGGN